MKRLIPILLIILSACKANLPEIPTDVMAMDAMVRILADIHIVDALAVTQAHVGENEKKLSTQYNGQVLKNHGITKEEFLKSLKFYENNPVLLNMIYDKVLVELSKREEQVSKLPKTDKQGKF